MEAPLSETLHSTELPASPASRSAFNRYVFALAAVLVAFLIRRALDPVLATRPVKHYFITFIVATTVVAWYSGFVPSIITALLGFAVADYFFIVPIYSLGVSSNQFIDTMLPPLLVTMTIIFFGRSLHFSRDKSDALAREAIGQQKRLEAEATERRRIEAEVRRLNQELEQRVEMRTAELVASNQELESFTYSVSHDLRAPLRHVDGYAQILEEEFGPAMNDEAQMLMKKIRLGSQNMGRLVDDLLNLSRVGKQELSRQRVQVASLVESVIAETKMETPGREIEWKVGELPALDCDAGLIRQVFANLLSNAAKYSRPREHARIEVGECKTSNGISAIFVRDNGVGFNMKYSAKLFGVFQRLHRAEEFEGTGVGLATVARIIRKHGGIIWAEAEPDKGATFFFTVPPQEPGSSPAAHRNGNELNLPTPA